MHCILFTYFFDFSFRYILNRNMSAEINIFEGQVSDTFGVNQNERGIEINITSQTEYQSQKSFKRKLNGITNFFSRIKTLTSRVFEAMKVEQAVLFS